MLTYLVSGSIFGISAGLSPGPLLTLVIAESIRGGLRSGIRVSLAPLITDLPIVFVSLLVISRLSRFDAALGVISLCGAVFVAYLGYEGLHTKEMSISHEDGGNRSLQKGIIANFLNPHPYLFWFSVGSPIIVKAFAVNVLAPCAFVCGFYVFLVGSKIVLCLVIDRSRSLISGKAYKYTMQALGAVLVVFAIFLFFEGLGFLGL
ncbi:MAG TPA: LysE family translocator [Deltaproteobacteria bacterium]|nr:LysE family translocator [Deltaproteobacteria bacterium]